MNMSLHHDRWDEIAWNGISFYKPALWEIATIGRNYLMIGTLAYPRMEISWGNPNKPASYPQNIHRLLSRIRKQLTAVDPWTPSESWLRVLSSYEAIGFSWKRSVNTNYGLILTCLSCRRVSLIQFFQNADEPDSLEEVTPRVLSSFTDHADGNDRRWAVFDVRATLPTEFQIKSYQFSAGYMEMVFLFRGWQISLYRWSPASVLLSGRNLSDFAESLPVFAGRSPHKILDPHQVAWEHIPVVSFWNRLAALIPGKFSHHRMVIRHDPKSNRILAIKSDSRQMMDSLLIDRVFSNYEIAAP